MFIWEWLRTKAGLIRIDYYFACWLREFSESIIKKWSTRQSWPWAQRAGNWPVLGWMWSRFMGPKRDDGRDPSRLRSFFPSLSWPWFWIFLVSIFAEKRSVTIFLKIVSYSSWDEGILHRPDTRNFLLENTEDDPLTGERFNRWKPFYTRIWHIWARRRRKILKV